MKIKEKIEELQKVEPKTQAQLLELGEALFVFHSKNSVAIRAIESGYPVKIFVRDEMLSHFTKLAGPFYVLIPESSASRWELRDSPNKKAFELLDKAEYALHKMQPEVPLGWQARLTQIVRVDYREPGFIPHKFTGVGLELYREGFRIAVAFWNAEASK